MGTITITSMECNEDKGLLLCHVMIKTTHFTVLTGLTSISKNHQTLICEWLGYQVPHCHIVLDFPVNLYQECCIWGKFHKVLEQKVILDHFNC